MPTNGQLVEVYKWDYQQIGETFILLDDGSYVRAVLHQTGRSSIATQRFDADLFKVGEELNIDNNFKIAFQSGYEASVGLTGGGYALGWYISKTVGSSFNGVYMQLFNADGSEKSDEIRLGDFNNLAVGDYKFDMVALSGGGVAVSWVFQDISSFQIISAAGGFVGSTTRLSTLEENTYEHREKDEGPSLTVLNNGNILATWFSRTIEKTDTIDGGIKGRLFKPDGTAIGAEFDVGKTPISVIYKGSNAPVVTALKDGGSMVVWAEGIPTGTPVGFVPTKHSIHGQILNADGSKRGNEFDVDSTLGFGKIDLSMTTLKDGSIVVVWNVSQQIEEYKHNQGNSRIYGQKLDIEGNKQGGEFRVDLIETETHNAKIPHVYATNDGGFIVDFNDGKNPAFNNTHAIKFGDGEFIAGGFTDKTYDNGTVKANAQGAVINGTSLSDYIQGNYHGDEIFGGKGDDILLGGRGDDKIYGSQGNDFIVGETGYDLIVDGLGNNTLYGKGERDEIFTFSGLNDIRGGNAADILMGGIHADKITSGNFLGVETHEKTDPHGAGVIIGDSSTLFGSADFLDGGGGGVYMMGGKGADTFFFEHGDFGGATIATFNIADITINKSDVGTFYNYIVTPTGSDFQPDVDHIELFNFSTDLTSDNVLDAITNTDDGAKFVYGSNEFLLYGIEKSELSADDFWIL